jgi:hypothetical protein
MASHWNGGFFLIGVDLDRLDDGADRFGDFSFFAVSEARTAAWLSSRCS